MPTRASSRLVRSSTLPMNLRSPLPWTEEPTLNDDATAHRGPRSPGPSNRQEADLQQLRFRFGQLRTKECPLTKTRGYPLTRKPASRVANTWNVNNRLVTGPHSTFVPMPTEGPLVEQQSETQRCPYARVGWQTLASAERTVWSGTCFRRGGAQSLAELQQGELPEQGSCASEACP
jgi:hypothetical protein